MLQKEVKEWLAEYKGLAPTEIHSFACTLALNEDLLAGLYDLFETPPYYVQELDPVCHQLYEFYRSKEKKLVLFALQFVPVLTWLYLRCLSFHDKKSCSGAETFLLAVYNLEIVTQDGTQKVDSFRIPTVSRSSLYHESRIGGDVLTEHNLRQLNNVHGTWRSGPFTQHARFNAQNRFSILSHLMLVFNNHIDSIPSLSLDALCRVTAKLCSAGFVTAKEKDSQASRIALQPSLLIEFLAGIYYAMYNGYNIEAHKAVEAAHERASYELYSDVLLVTNGLLNSHDPSHFSEEPGPAIEQKRKKPHALKNFITNASFKAKKLPDDIEIIEEEGTAAHAPSRLTTVDEEGGSGIFSGADHSVTKGLKARLKTRLSGGPSKHKDASIISAISTSKKDSADYTSNNAGMSVGGSSHQQSPRRDGDTGLRKEGDSHGNMGRKESDSSSIDSVGQAVKTFSLGGAGDRGGSKVVVDMLEMEPIKGNLPTEDGEDDENNDLYDSYNVASFQAQSPRQGLWAAPSTPSPTSSPAQSPLARASSKKSSAHNQSGVDPPSPQAVSGTTANGKAFSNTNSGSNTTNTSSNNTTSTGYHRASSNTSRFSHSNVGGSAAAGVSQSKTSPSLAADQNNGSGLSLEKSPSSMSSPPSSSSPYQSPRDAFFGITESSKSLKKSSSSNQSGSASSPNSSNSAIKASSPSPSTDQAGQSQSATKVNRNSYSTDL